MFAWPLQGPPRAAAPRQMPSALTHQHTVAVRRRDQTPVRKISATGWCLRDGFGADTKRWSLFTAAEPSRLPGGGRGSAQPTDPSQSFDGVSRSPSPPFAPPLLYCSCASGRRRVTLVICSFVLMGLKISRFTFRGPAVTTSVRARWGAPWGWGAFGMGAWFCMIMTF